MRRICIECGRPIDPIEEPHAAHEPSCTVDPKSEDWACRCDVVAHRRCCRACDAVIDVPGQLNLLETA